MKFIPNFKKFEKRQKGKKNKRINKVITFHNLFISKTYFFKALENCKLNFIQLQAFYKSCKKLLKRSGKIILKVFTHIPTTKKPLEVRMGKGKGVINSWIVKIKKGITLCEIKCNKIILVKKIFKISKLKLPFRIMLFSL